jgi:hypothetical protein
MYICSRCWRFSRARVKLLCHVIQQSYGRIYAHTGGMRPEADIHMQYTCMPHMASVTVTVTADPHKLVKNKKSKKMRILWEDRRLSAPIVTTHNYPAREPVPMQWSDYLFITWMTSFCSSSRWSTKQKPQEPCETITSTTGLILYQNLIDLRVWSQFYFP